MSLEALALLEPLSAVGDQQTTLGFRVYLNPK